MPELFYIILGLVLLLVIYLGISYYFFKQLFYHFNQKGLVLVDENDEFYKRAYEWYEDIPKESETISSYDGLKLHGIYIPARDKHSNKLAIVMHGYQSKARDMMIIAKMYSDMGFQVLVIDQRAHGQSQGKFTSVGYYESYDLKKWLHFVTRNYGANINILLHGVSMGAATAVLATRFRESNNVKMMVLDSCFTNFKDTLKLSTDHGYQKLFIPGVNLMSRFILKFGLKTVNPLKHIRRSNIPSIFIYGSDDKVITKKMTESLHHHLKSQQKEILIIEGARHAKGFELDKDRYIQHVLDMASDIFKIKKADIKFFQ